jgi:hypothetical protein
MESGNCNSLKLSSILYSAWIQMCYRLPLSLSLSLSPQIKHHMSNPLLYRSLLNPHFVEERVMWFFSHFLHNRSFNGTQDDRGQVKPSEDGWSIRNYAWTRKDQKGHTCHEALKWEYGFGKGHATKRNRQHTKKLNTRKIGTVVRHNP